MVQMNHAQGILNTGYERHAYPLKDEIEPAEGENRANYNDCAEGNALSVKENVETDSTSDKRMHRIQQKETNPHDNHGREVPHLSCKLSNGRSEHVSAENWTSRQR
jgi:hypothetical protein